MKRYHHKVLKTLNKNTKESYYPSKDWLHTREVKERQIQRNLINWKFNMNLKRKLFSTSTTRCSRRCTSSDNKFYHDNISFHRWSSGIQDLTLKLLKTFGAAKYKSYLRKGKFWWIKWVCGRKDMRSWSACLRPSWTQRRRPSIWCIWRSTIFRWEDQETQETVAVLSNL